MIVLAFHHENYIAQALDSILMQKTDFSYEILIGDDASTDHTADIIRDYARRYPNIIHPILRQENIGATNNLYDLLIRARGCYIANLEGDDYWTDSEKLQSQVDWLDRHPENIGSYHLCTVVDEMGNNVQKPNWISEKQTFRFMDFQGLFLPGHPSSWLYRNIYKEPQYDYSIITKAHSVIADRTIAMLLLAQGDFALIPKAMSCYRSIKKTDGENATSQIFVNQDNSKYVEYRLTLDLEHYARNTLAINADFSSFRKKLFLKTLVKLLLKPCRSRWQCLMDIIHLIQIVH